MNPSEHHTNPNAPKWRNTMNLTTRLGLIFGILLLHQPLWGGSCNMAQIDAFLQRGFTHEQVVELCATPAPTTPKKDSAPTTSPASRPPHALSDSSIDKDTFYLQTVIDADRVKVNPEAIIYWRDKCFKYGAEDFTGFRPEACVNMRTTINRKGLKVVRAAKGIILIRDQELIVDGNIKQDVLNPEKLKPKILKTFHADYPSSPTRINIPVKKGIDPVKVAETLKRLTVN